MQLCSTQLGTPLGTLQALLGRSSSEMTRDVYLHLIPADARAAVQKVEDLVMGLKLTQVVESAKPEAR
jgi:integrase